MGLARKAANHEVPARRLCGVEAKADLVANGFVSDGGAHEKIQKDEAAQGKARLNDAADQGIELQQAAEGPSRRPGGADHFRANQNGDGEEGREINPIYVVSLSQVSVSPFGANFLKAHCVDIQGHFATISKRRPEQGARRRSRSFGDEADHGRRCWRRCSRGRERNIRLACARPKANNKKQAFRASETWLETAQNRETPMSREAADASDAHGADLPWFASYPPNVPTRIAAAPYRLLGDIAPDLAARQGEMRAFTTILPNGMAASLSFAEIDHYSDAFAAYLREILLLEAGDRVAI